MGELDATADFILANERPGEVTMAGVDAMVSELRAVYPPWRMPRRYILGERTAHELRKALDPKPTDWNVDIFGVAASDGSVPVLVSPMLEPDAAHVEMQDGAIVNLRRQRPEEHGDG